MLRLLLLGALCALMPARGEAQTALITDLASLRAAAADSTVKTFLLQQDIVLNGTAVDITRAGQAVTIQAATYPCASGGAATPYPASPACPALDARGLSRAFTVTAATLIVRGLKFSNCFGAGHGGCILGTVTTLGTVENSHFANSRALGVRCSCSRPPSFAFNF